MTNEDIEEAAQNCLALGDDPEYFPTQKDIADTMRELVAGAYEESARIAEAPIANGHSAETRVKGDYANLIARNIRAVRDSIVPKEKRTRRLS